MTTLLAAVIAALGMVMIAPSAQADSVHGGWFFPTLIGEGRNACPNYHVCVWDGDNFTGAGRAYAGNVVPGDYVEWFSTTWQDDVQSAVNKGTVAITFMNIYGSSWSSLGSLLPGYDFRSGWPGATYADGLGYF